MCQDRTCAECLMDQVRDAADQSAFTRLERRFSELLHRIARRFLVQRELAEDAVQETLLRIWDRRRQWRSGQNFVSWCCAILRHHCLDELRRRRTRASGALDRVELPTPERQQDAADLSLDWTGLFSRLPDTQRRAVELHLQGMGFELIGETLQISTTTAYRYYKEGLDRLGGWLGGPE